MSSFYEKEIYNENDFVTNHKDLFEIVKSHFDEKKPIEDFYFSQCLFSDNYVTVTYILEGAEDYSFMFEAEIGKEREGKGEFAWD